MPLLVVLALASSLSASEQQMIVRNSLSSNGVNVIGWNSPDFDPLVKKLLSADAWAKVSDILPYSVIVANNTGKYIWGFTVVYSFPDKISPSGKPWTHRISPSTGGSAERSRMLEPGATFLITPVSDFLASADSKGMPVLQPLVDDGLDRMIADFQSRHQQGERITLDVDSVIFEDGTLEGPDSEQMLLRVNDRIRAERDVTAEMANRHGDTLRKFLLLHASNTGSDEYAFRSAAVAQGMLQLLDQHGETATSDLAKKMCTKQWFVGSENVRRK